MTKKNPQYFVNPEIITKSKKDAAYEEDVYQHLINLQK